MKQIFFYLIIAILFTPAFATGFTSYGKINKHFAYKDLKIKNNTVRGAIINKSKHEYTNLSFNIYATDCAEKNRFWKAWCSIENIFPGQKVPFKGYIKISSDKKMEGSPCKIYFRKYTGRPAK